MGISAYFIVYGRMGTNIVASMAIVNIFEKVLFTLLIGLGNACAIIVGNKIGEGKEEEAYEVSKKCMKYAVLMGMLAGAIMLMLSKPAISIFNVSKEVSDTAFLNMIVMCTFLWLKSLGFVNFIGVLRSGGDTKYALYLELGSMWLYGVPIAFLAGLYFKLPVYWVYTLVSMEEILKGIIALKRVFSKKWINNLTHTTHDNELHPAEIMK